MAKALILYYSFEGSTQKVAEWIAAETNSDIERITPLKELKSTGFSKYFWGGSQVVMKRKPKIKPIQRNLEEYDTIFIGSPIWAGTFAPPIYTLLEKGYLKTKRIAYFYSHEGGDAKAVEKAVSEINKENIFIDAFSCLFVQKNFESIKDQIGTWAKDIIHKGEHK